MSKKTFKLISLIYLFISAWTLIFTKASGEHILEAIQALLLIYVFVISGVLFYIWLDKNDYL